MQNTSSRFRVGDLGSYAFTTAVIECLHEKYSSLAVAAHVNLFTKFLIATLIGADILYYD